MHHNKQKSNKKGTKADTVASVSRMDAILQEIDRVISKKKPENCKKDKDK